MAGGERNLTVSVEILIVLCCVAGTVPNNYAPKFTQKIYSQSVPEDVPVGKVVLLVRALDKDPGSVVKYDFSSSFPPSAFSINKTSGEISVAHTLDRETEFSYYIPVVALDDGIPQKSGSALVSITVRDANDNRPAFSPAYYSTEVNDILPIGQSILTLTAVDKDIHHNAALKYQIVGGDELNATFSVTSNGDIVLLRKLDFTRWRFYNLSVQAIDTGDSPLMSRNNAVVLITVITNRFLVPQFTLSHYLFMTREDVTVPYLVGEIDAIYFNPRTGHDNDDVLYQIESGNSAGNFHVSASGNLSVVKSLDREADPVWRLVVSATDVLNRSISNMTVVEVSVLDVNDNKPVLLPRGLLDATVLESAVINHTIVQFTCSDDDTGPNGDVALSLQDPTSAFGLTGNDLVLKKQPLVLSNSTFNLTVLCSDFGFPSLISQTLVRVHVINVNMHSPVFDKQTYFTRISENAQIGTSVVKVYAADKDNGQDGKIVYSLTGSHLFTIDPRTGIVYTDKSLDRETKEKYTLQVVATDQGVPSHSGSTVLTVMVDDVNDNGPRCERAVYDVYVSENANEVVNVNCVDRDLNAQPIYRVVEESDPDVFGIEVKGIVVVKNDLSQRTPVYYWLKIQVEDSNPLVQTQTVNLTVFIHVNRSNDFPPVFEHGGVFKWDVPEQTAVDTTVNRVTANDDDVGPDGQIRYSLVGGTGRHSFSVNATDGSIRLERQLSIRNGDSLLTLIVEAIDQAVSHSSRKTDKAEVTFKIIDVSPRIELVAKTVNVWRSAQVGTSVVNATCISTVSNDKEVRFSLLGLNRITGFLTVDTQGNVKVNKLLGDLNLGNYSVTVSCQDNNSYRSSASFVLTLAEPIAVTASVSPSEKFMSMEPTSKPTYLMSSGDGVGPTVRSPDSSSETLIVAVIGSICGVLVIVLVMMVAVIVRWRTEHGYVLVSLPSLQTLHGRVYYRSYKPGKEKPRKNLNNELTEVTLQK